MTLSALPPVLWRAGKLWVPVGVAMTGLAALMYGAAPENPEVASDDQLLMFPPVGIKSPPPPV